MAYVRLSCMVMKIYLMRYRERFLSSKASIHQLKYAMKYSLRVREKPLTRVSQMEKPFSDPAFVNSLFQKVYIPL